MLGSRDRGRERDDGPGVPRGRGELLHESGGGFNSLQVSLGTVHQNPDPGEPAGPKENPSTVFQISWAGGEMGGSFIHPSIHLPKKHLSHASPMLGGKELAYSVQTWPCHM